MSSILPFALHLVFLGFHIPNETHAQFFPSHSHFSSSVHGGVVVDVDDIAAIVELVLEVSVMEVLVEELCVVLGVDDVTVIVELVLEVAVMEVLVEELCVVMDVDDVTVLVELVLEVAVMEVLVEELCVVVDVDDVTVLVELVLEVAVMEVLVEELCVDEVVPSSIHTGENRGLPAPTGWVLK